MSGRGGHHLRPPWRPARSSPRTRSRRFASRSTRARSAIETDVWLSADGEVVCVHDPVVVPRPAPPQDLGRDRGGAGDLRDSALRRRLPRARHGVRVLRRREDRRHAAEGLVAVARAHDALERLWVCSPDVELLRDAARRDAGEARALRPAEPRSARRWNATRSTSPSAGIDAMNLHHTEWTAGLVSLFHRFDVRAFAWDTQEVRHIRAVLADGDRRRVLRPSRPHGRDRERVGRRLDVARPRPRQRTGQRMPRRFSGQIRRNTRPTISLFWIAPKSASRASRAVVAHHAVLGRWGSGRSGSSRGERRAVADRARGQVRLVERLAVDEDRDRPSRSTVSPGSPITRLTRSLIVGSIGCRRDPSGS